MRRYPIPIGIEIDCTLEGLQALVGRWVLVTDWRNFGTPGILRHEPSGERHDDTFSIPVESGFMSFRKSDVWGVYQLGGHVIVLAT